MKSHRQVLTFYFDGRNWHWLLLGYLPNGTFWVQDQNQTPVDLNSDIFLPAIEVLSQIKASLNPQTSQVILGIPSQIVSFQSLELPFIQKHQIQKVLPFQLEEWLPYEILQAQVTFFHHPDVNQKCSQVLVASALKSELEKWYQPFGNMKLPLRRAVPLNLALYNALWPEALYLKKNSSSDKWIVDVYVDAYQTLVNLIKDGKLWHAASFEWDLKQLLKTLNIENFHQLSQIQIYRQNGQDLIIDEKPLQPLENWVDQLQWILLSWLKWLPENNWQIRLSGLLTQLVGVHLYLTQKLQVPVNLIHLEDIWPYHAFQNLPDGALNLDILGFGLSLEALKKPSQGSWQLLYPPYLVTDQFFKFFWEKNHPLLTIPPISLALLFLGLNVKSWMMRLALEKQTQMIVQMTKDILGPRTSLALMERESQKIRKNWQRFQAFLKNLQQPDALNHFYVFMQAFDKKPAQGPIVKDIQANDKQIQVTLQDPRLSVMLPQWVRQWENSGFFEKVEIVNQNNQQATVRLKVL